MKVQLPLVVLPQQTVLVVVRLALVLYRVLCALLGVLVNDRFLSLAGLSAVELVLADQGKTWYFVVILL